MMLGRVGRSMHLYFKSDSNRNRFSVRLVLSPEPSNIIKRLYKVKESVEPFLVWPGEVNK